MASKLSVLLNENELHAVFNRLDINHNGFIEFEEFNKIMIEDPYK